MDSNKRKSLSSKLPGLCRTCLMADSELDMDLYQIADIFLEEDEVTAQIQSFADVLCLFVDDEVGNQKDRLPKGICMACIEKARSAFQFIEMCRQTDALLLELFGDSKQESELEGVVVADQLEVEAEIPQETHDVFIEEIEMQHTEKETTEVKDRKDVKTIDSTKEESNPLVAKLSKRHICDVCFKTFSQPQTLTRHKKIHSKDSVPRKSCHFCCRTFLRADDLRRHIRTHTNERPYVCELCTKAYKQSFELKEHKASAHPEFGVRKVHTCTICNKQLTTRNGLYVHMKAHRGEKNHVCGFCDKRFVTSGELSSHLKHIHTNEIKAEQMPCGVEGCAKQFVTKAALRHHRITKHAHIDKTETN